MKNSKETPIKREYSSGGAVFRKLGTKNQKPRTEWLITQPDAGNEPWRQGRWQLAKGWIEEGETGQQAALREVKEEGGVKAKIVDKIGRIDIFFYNEEKQKVIKNIVFFLMEYQSGSEKDHDQETSQAIWLPYDQAYDRLTFKSEKGILEKAKKILEEKEKQPSLL